MKKFDWVDMEDRWKSIINFDLKDLRMLYEYAYSKLSTQQVDIIEEYIEHHEWSLVFEGITNSLIEAGFNNPSKEIYTAIIRVNKALIEAGGNVDYKVKDYSEYFNAGDANQAQK